MKLCLSCLLLVLFALPTFAALRDTTNSADYLIVTTGSLIRTTPWIQQLADWRSTHGRTAMIVATDSIWNEFGNGSPSDTVLKDFLFYAYDHWSVPRLRDVFIIGWHDIVPSHILHIDPDNVLSDYYYTVRADADSCRPLFSLGRLPWSPAQSPDLYDYGSKVIAYESQDPAPWQSRIHLLADADNVIHFDVESESTVAHLDTFYSVVRDYIGYPPGDPSHGDTVTIMQHLNEGSLIVSPMCRADFGTWGYGLHLTPEKLDTLSNGSRLPVVVGMQMDVSANDFALSGLPQAWLANPAGGAIAYFGVSYFSYMVPITRYHQALIERATTEPPGTLGDLWRSAIAGFYPENFQALAMLFGDPGVRLPPRPQTTDGGSILHPSSFTLSNYPNPFNPSTRIEFELDHAARVSLKIMNVLGQEVATLVNDQQLAGRHTVEWQADSQPSGIYFAVLQAGEVHQVRKMILMK
jgi:hypothetical protein